MGRSAGPEPCGRAPTVSWNGGCRRIRGTSPRSSTRDGAGPELSRPSLRIRPASRRFSSNGALPGRSGAALIRAPSPRAIRDPQGHQGPGATMSRGGGAGRLRPRVPARDARRRAAEALRLWRRSLFCRQGGGHISYQWHFLPLTQNMLKKMAARNELLVGQDIAVVLWTEKERRTAFASVLAGGQRGLTAARRAAGERGYAAVQTFLPRDPRIVRWAREAGFIKGSWGTRAVLYERRV